jgi:hypothetical protein
VSVGRTPNLTRFCVPSTARSSYQTLRRNVQSTVWQDTENSLVRQSSVTCAADHHSTMSGARES